MNPFDDVLYGNIPKPTSGKEQDYQYKAKPFIPTVPYHPESNISNPDMTVKQDSINTTNTSSQPR